MSDEQRRLNEQIFIIYVQRLFRKTANPVFVYDYIEMICGICDADFIAIQNIITRVMAEDRSVLPSKKEAVYIYKMLGFSVRDICKEAHISQRDYYNRREYTETKTLFYNTAPRFSEEEGVAIDKVLDFIYNTTPGKRGY